MNPEPKPIPASAQNSLDFAEPLPQTLEFLEPLESASETPVMESAVAPVMEAIEAADPSVEVTGREATIAAGILLKKLTAINLGDIDDQDLRPARIQVGLAFVGFGALMLIFLLLYLNNQQPDLTAAERIQHHWYEYVWFLGLGVAGLFMLGRESMRSPLSQPHEED